MRHRLGVGIEPIIATVILVAVALIISVAVIGYFMGLFGGLVGGQPQVYVTGVTARALNEGKRLNVTMYLSNAGTASDRLTRVSAIIRGKSYDIAGSAVEGLSAAGTYASVPAGFRGWVTFEVDLKDDTKIEVGDTVLIRLFFERSGQHTVTVVVSA